MENNDSLSNEIGGWKNVRLDRRFDWVGPPHKLSRIRPIKLRRIQGETVTELAYREALEDLNDWNCRFWCDHNALYERKRREFVEKRESCIVHNDDLSEFYKSFIDERYNKWHKRNFSLLWPALKVNLIRFQRLLRFFSH
ncbi:unnamed protein product [Dracunculus medinensis]|uniref:Uncharacterized protein n=1 Tax=Dracunculus medinensis TaxID=318479 RepID=A0A0N4UCN8_DRAME|nr:unnamed protein product [Dracunculus medinensis]